ncbi:MAG: gluconate 2-dehydrogenase gamma chain [Actinomycetota bacterium]
MDTFGRRGFLKAAGGIGLLALVPAARLRALAASAPAAGQPGRFLTAHELDTLRAVTARLLPGPPDDVDPGAVEAGAAEAIDLFLAAFTVEPPLIHAGGPYSNRAGASHDDLADFVALDRLAELGWRIRLEGSLGLPGREFAGPVRGLQQIYREGLAHLDERAAPAAFTDLPGPLQDLVLQDQSDDAVQELVGAALTDTLHAVYGPPEYGGNRDLVGWQPIGWRGDVQPRGYTAAEVSEPDPSGGTVMSRAAAARALARFMPAAAAAAHPPPTTRWWG